MTENNTDLSSALDAALSEYSVDAPVESPVEEVAAEEAVVEETLETEVEETEVAEDNLEDDQVEEVVVDEVEEETEEADETSEEDAETEDDVVTLDPDAEVIIDGQRVKVKDALQMRADYTRKTQELSEERQAFETEKEQLSEQLTYLTNLEEAWTEDPSDVIAGMTGSTDDPIETITNAVRALATDGGLDPNLLIVKTVVDLIGHGLLEDDLRLQMGFDDDVVEKIRQQVKQDTRIAKLERQVSKPAEKPEAVEEDRSAAIAEARKQLENQWAEVVAAEEDLSSLSDEALSKVRIEVAKYALDKGGIPLDVAYAAMQASKLKAERAAKAKADEARAKKAKTRVSAKPTTSEATATPRTPTDLEGAIREALDDLRGKG